MGQLAFLKHVRVGPLAVAMLLLGFVGCNRPLPRRGCAGDGDCPVGQVCYSDNLCVPGAVALRRGATLGVECTVDNGAELGCSSTEVRCRMGNCLLPDGTRACQDTPTNALPLFGGPTSAAPDGEDAVVVQWANAADETPPNAVTYLVAMSTAEGKEDFTSPVATLVGKTTYRATGLTPGTTYYFKVRAKDEGGLVECNQNEVSATPKALGTCVDYQSGAKQVFDNNCIRCHSGATAPQGLHLDSYEGVLRGGLTGSEVIKCQPPLSLVFQKISMSKPPVGVRMPFDGPPYLGDFQIETIRRWLAGGAVRSCGDPTPCDDATAPTFAGLTSAVLAPSKVGATLCWAAGADNLAAPSSLVYDIFQATAPGGEVFTSPPRASSGPGATCSTVEGLTPGQEFCFVVRARDEAGNRDANGVEKCVTVPAAACVDFATVVQPIFTSRCIKCHSGPSAPRNLHLDSYEGVRAGGLTGNEVVACQPLGSLLYNKISMDKPPVGARMPFDGPPYLADSQIAIIKQWIEEGARRTCADNNPCNDGVPPTFAGATSATALNATSANVCWAAGTDDATPVASLVYDVYAATASGAQDFAASPSVSTAAGALCARVDALSPGSPYCFVTRARDAAGNRDANTVERCVTLPALPAGCVDYATYLKPLFEKNCTRCHSGEMPPQSLRLDSYENVIAGSVRRIEVDACNPGGSLLVGKISVTPPLGKRMPFDGPPYLTAGQISMVSQWIAAGATRTCSETVACADVTPPTFAGISSATASDETTVKVCWGSASDSGTPATSLRYDLYEARTSGAQDFTQPAQQSVVNQSCTLVKVGSGKTVCFVARARDLVGNVSANLQEACATTPASPCAVDYPLVRPIFAARCAHCHKAGTGPRFLDLTSYGGILAAGAIRNEVRACDPGNSFLLQKISGATCGQQMPFDGPPWVAPSQKSLLEAWIGSGARESCAQAAPCADTAAPTFFGAQSVQALSANLAKVCWLPATDNVSTTGSITYDVYESVAPGGEYLSAPASYTAPAGSTCLEVPVPPAERTCFMVRARDLKGNRDTNTTERCVDMPKACLDYTSRVQALFDVRCVQCHSGPNAPKGVQWDTYAHAISNGQARACDPSGGKMLEYVDYCYMPRDTAAGYCSTVACLTPSQRRLLRAWVNQGLSAGCPEKGCP